MKAWLVIMMLTFQHNGVGGESVDAEIYMKEMPTIGVCKTVRDQIINPEGWELHESGKYARDEDSWSYPELSLQILKAKCVEDR